MAEAPKGFGMCCYSMKWNEQYTYYSGIPAGFWIFQSLLFAKELRQVTTHESNCIGSPRWVVFSEGHVGHQDGTACRSISKTGATYLGNHGCDVATRTYLGIDANIYPSVFPNTLRLQSDFRGWMMCFRPKPSRLTSIESHSERKPTKIEIW